MAGQLRQLLRLKTFRSYLVDLDAYRHGPPVCPTCRSRLHIHPQGYVCSNVFCEQPVGHVLDWMVRASGMTPDEAIHHMLMTYGEDGIELTGPTEVLHQMIDRQWHNEHRIQQWLHRIRKQSTLDKRPANVQACSLLRRWGLEEGDWFNFVWPADSGGLEELQPICSQLGFDTVDARGADGWLVFPFFATPDRVAEFAIMNVWERTVIRWTRHTTKLAWAGLLRADPERTPVVFENPIEAMVWNHASQATGLGRQCLAVRLYSEYPEQPMWPERLVWVQGKHGSVTTASRLSRMLRVSVTSSDAYDRELEERPIDDMLQSTFEDLAANAELNPQALTKFLQETQPTEETVRGWLEHVQRAELQEAERLLLRFAAKKVVFTNEAMEILQTEEGYYAVKRNEDDPAMITNFYVTLRETVVFRQSAVHRVTHCGSLVFGRRSYDFTCEAEDLQEPRRFEHACRNAEEADPQRRRDDLLPSVVDRGLCRHVLLHLRKQAAQLPKSQGLLHLGWNEEGTLFECPFGRVRDTTLDIRRRRGDPSVQFFRLFDLDKPALDSPLLRNPQLEPGMLRLLACCVALVVRSRFRRPVQPIPVLNNEAARTSLPAIWAELGQTRPYLLNANDRVGSDRVPSHGFPVYASGPHTLHVLRGAQSFVVIGELGLSIERLEPERAKVVGSIFRRALVEAAKLALTDRGLPERKEGGLLLQLAEEGMVLLSILTENLALTDNLANLPHDEPALLL